MRKQQQNRVGIKCKWRSLLITSWVAFNRISGGKAASIMAFTQSIPPFTEKALHALLSYTPKKYIFSSAR